MKLIDEIREIVVCGVRLINVGFTIQYSIGQIFLQLNTQPL